MSTLEEKKQLLNKRISEISKTYEDNVKEAELGYDEASRELLIISQNKKLKQDQINRGLVYLTELNDADMGRFVNKEFLFFMTNLKEMATYLLDLANDIDQNIPKIETHHETFLALKESLEKKKKQDEEEHLKKIEDQKRYKDLTGKMYG